MDTERIFQQRLRQVRQATGLSQKKAAAELGLTDTGYRNYETGTRRPTFEVLPRLADFFDVSTDYLLGRSDDPHLPRMDEETKNLFLALRALKGNAGAAQ